MTTTLLAPPTVFRIMSTREIAPGWFGAPVEVGETTSATVANLYCDQQNAVSMNADQPVRKQFYAEPGSRA